MGKPKTAADDDSRATGRRGVEARGTQPLPRVVSSAEGNLFVRLGDTYHQITQGEVIEVRAPPPAAITGSGLPSAASAIKQSLDFVRVAAARNAYAASAAEAARGINELHAKGYVSAQQAEELVIAARRALEAQTRASLPGDLAEGLNQRAAQRNLAKYGDKYGWRDAAHLRSKYPDATTETILEKAGSPNPGVTGAGRVMGAVGVIGTAVAVISLAEDFRNISHGGRIQVELKDLDPGDFPVGYEIKGVFLGRDSKEGDFFGDIKVDRNILGRRKFYLVKAYSFA